MTRLLATLLLVLFVAGCAGPRSYTQLTGLQDEPRCRELLADMEGRIRTAGTRDRSAHPLDDFPYLRVDRFLASFAGQLAGPAQRRAWHGRLLALGSEARALELDNLPRPFTASERQAIETCIRRLADADRAAPGFYQRVQQQARVPSGYSTPQRVLGLFPLTRLVVLHQIERWNAIWEPAFNAPRFAKGVRIEYRPLQAVTLEPDRIRAWLAQARAASPLAIPELPDARLQALFHHFAPRWQVRQASSADRIGALYWGQDGRPQVDGARPVVYQLPSYTRFQGQILLQLNYQVWFGARPAQGLLDIYAGHLDGLIWRVTLDSDGQVLAYDSIHACGCYHFLFPVSEEVRLHALDPDEENPLIFFGAPDRDEERLSVRITDSHHYLVGLSLEKDQGTEVRDYRLQPYQTLLRLPDGQGGTRSLFDPGGRVASSRRLERFLLWPMGVPSAGAMRQWGQHLISFTGQRHFDDPFLLSEFLLRPGPPGGQKKR
ncbi:hypothetical protein [Motiliproteus sp. SC1-56]|uniref:hypothetical protein n=1 Tax=Motiliproteus sp. SC1-56 TaxID=2799565 RepID=UPI001A8ED84C|nr:hypothetical protein [Motiliproteus sp. SC1-56]